MRKTCLFKLSFFSAILLPTALLAEQFDIDKGYHSFSQQPFWKVKGGFVNPSELQESLENGKTVCSGEGWFTEEFGRSNPGKTAGSAESPFVTYCKVFEMQNVPSGPVAIRLSEIDDKDRAFLNGKFIGSTGDMSSDTASGYDKTRIYSFDSGLLKKGKNIVLVHVKGYSVKENWGMITERTGIGKTSSVYTNFFIENFSQLFFLTVYVTVGSYFLFLFLNRKNEKENLIFALFTFNLVIYQFLRTQLKYELLDSFIILKKIEYLVLGLLVPLLYLFIRTYFKIQKKFFNITLNILGGIGVALTLIFLGSVFISSEPMVWSQFNKYLNLMSAWPIFLIQIIAVVGYRSFQKDKDALIFISGLAVLIGTAFIDSLSTYGVVNLPRLAGYGFFVFILNIALILANRFVRLHKEVEYLNKNLEQKVQERTNELNQSLNEVSSLKERQDGDYYLTSLLIKPLASSSIDRAEVSVEAYTEQKKKFQFRSKSSEIGGDISIAENIALDGRDYTAFMNADAMGKSIQGAGGALVAGTVFKALISRTRTVPDSQNRPPERWLKEAYREIQDVFCTFDGSMLISASIGLIDNASGTVYYMNAEHPWAVLYRKGKAIFLEDDLMFYKFGVEVESITIPFFLRVFSLQPGDALIFGSDGRDDILIENQGQKLMNEDTDLFLKHIEYANGNLDEIAESIHRAGEVTDDLSLLKITYAEDGPVIPIDRKNHAERLVESARAIAGSNSAEAIQKLKDAIKEYPEGAFTHRELGMLLARKKDFPGALKAYEKAFDLDPSDLETLFMLSFLTRRSGSKKSDIEKAAEFGERVRIRKPDHVRNLLNLAECYRVLSNSRRAEKIAKEVIEKDPASAEKARRILKELESSAT